MNPFEKRAITFKGRVSWKLRKIFPLILALKDFKRKNFFSSPFNGQQKRIEFFEQLTKIVRPSFICETGSSFGNTTEHFCRTQTCPIFSAEINKHAYYFTTKRLSGYPNLCLFNCDSRIMLLDVIKAVRAERLLDETGIPYFYLDAHWYADLPLEGELNIIFDSFEEFVILIDDFKVPHDSGYAFDVYDQGEIGVEIVPKHRDIKIYFPAIASSQETGLRKGLGVVVRSGKVAEILDQLGLIAT